MIQKNRWEEAGRDRLLLTVTLPVKEGPVSPFHAAMISFPKGAVQQILQQLQDREILLLILEGLEHDPRKLEKAAGRMGGRDCPGVRIEPVETVGYYHLDTEP